MSRKILDKNCLNCEHFVWWDGDYCCVANFKILCESKRGDFSKDMLKSMKTPETCKDYKLSNNKIHEMYEELFNKFLKEYESKNKEN